MRCNFLVFNFPSLEGGILKKEKESEKLSEEIEKLRKKVLKIKNKDKFMKLKNWKQFRANVEKDYDSEKNK